MAAKAADTPASVYLQAEDIRVLVSLSCIERKTIRWRKATPTEAKRVVNISINKWRKIRTYRRKTIRPALRLPTKALPVMQQRAKAESCPLCSTPTPTDR